MSRILDSNALPKISILIPAYNEEKVIESKLIDIAVMEYPLSRREVILIEGPLQEGVEREDHRPDGAAGPV